MDQNDSKPRFDNPVAEYLHGETGFTCFNDLHKAFLALKEQAENQIRMETYIQRQIEWSRSTFGTGPRTKGIVHHIQKELQEILDAPSDITEWCDVIILALDGAWRAGHTPQQIMEALVAKQAANFRRTYPPPQSQDHPSEHLREETPQ